MRNSHAVCHSHRSDQGFPHPGLFVPGTQVGTVRVDLGRVDDPKHLEDFSSAVLVSGGASLVIKPEDGVLERLKGFEQLEKCVIPNHLFYEHQMVLSFGR